VFSKTYGLFDQEIGSPMQNWLGCRQLRACDRQETVGNTSLALPLGDTGEALNKAQRRYLAETCTMSAGRPLFDLNAPHIIYPRQSHRVETGCFLP
jgi:hypothetical protein